MSIIGFALLILFNIGAFWGIRYVGNRIAAWILGAAVIIFDLIVLARALGLLDEAHKVVI